MSTSSKHAMLLLRIALIALSLGVAATGAGAQTSTHLRFYMHDIVTPSPGTPATATRVARGTTPLLIAPATNFGDTFVINDPLTEGGVPGRGARAGVLHVRVTDGAGATAVREHGVHRGAAHQRQHGRRARQGPYPRQRPGAPRRRRHRRVPWRHRVWPAQYPLPQRRSGNAVLRIDMYLSV
ncbi:unnamed protein product [Urochloa humidicola]